MDTFAIVFFSSSNNRHGKTATDVTSLGQLQSLRTTRIDSCVVVKLEDKARFGYDHVKGAFALLSMIKAIYKKYRFASKETAAELRVHFVHARGTKMHLWSLEAPFKNTFIMQRVAVCEVPAEASESSSVLSLGSFAWKLKQLISKTSGTLCKMAEEHEAQVISLELGEEKQPEDLYLMVDKEIVKPVRGVGYGLLLPEDSE